MTARDLLPPEAWLSAVRKRLGTKDCEVLKVSTGKLGDDIGGFMGDHLQVTVSTLVDGKKQDLGFFVKLVPNGNDKHTEWVESSNSFPKETGLYSRLFTLYPETDIPWGPNVYYVQHDTIVMENLIDQDFQVVGRLKYLDYSHCELLLKTLAIFHAGSMIVDETRDKEKLSELYRDLLFENLFLSDESKKAVVWYRSVVETLASTVQLVGKYKNQALADRINAEEFKHFLYHMFDIVKPSKRFRNVVCHGDLWANNVLYKYDKNDDQTPVNARLVDFQICRYTPPALDVMSFLHLNTTREFRKANNQKLLSLYYNSLAEELDLRGYNVEHLLSRSEFDESCNLYKVFGCLLAPTYHHLNQLPTEILGHHLGDVNEFDFFYSNRIEKITVVCETNDYYRERLVSEVEELMEIFLERKSTIMQDILGECHTSNGLNISTTI